MARAWLNELIKNSYIPALRQLKDTSNGRKEAQRFTREIRSSWAQRGLKELSQQQGCMDDVRRSIKQALGADHFSLKYVKFSTKEYTLLNDQKQRRVATRNENIQVITDPDGIVNKAVRLLESREWSEIAAGLSVLTGRRIAELLSTAEFNKKTQWSVTFTGALKRKGELQKLSFEIPTLTTADRVIKALTQIRKELPEANELPASAINRSYERSVVQAVDRHFNGLIPARHGKDTLYTHANRAVYATIAEFWYCPPQVNGTEYRATIQGHYAVLDEENPELRRSLAASRHYADFEIADEVIAKYQGKRKGIKLGVSGIEPIEVFRKVAVIAEQKPATRKTRKTIHIWEADKQALEALFSQLGFTGSQQDRLHQLLKWAQKQAEGQRNASMNLPAPAIDTTAAEAIARLERQLQALTTKMNTLIEGREKKVATAVKAPMAQPESVAAIPASEKSSASASTATTPRKQRAAEVIATINQAIDAIMAHNDQADRRHDDKWAITTNGLKSYINAQNRILEIMQARAAEIHAHHERHGLNPSTHNLRHRGKVLSEVIKIDDG